MLAMNTAMCYIVVRLEVVFSFGDTDLPVAEMDFLPLLIANVVLRCPFFVYHYATGRNV